MIKKINEIQCVCDCCRKIYTVKEEKDNPLNALAMPAVFINEYGGFDGYTVGKVEVCGECLKQMKKNIDNYYSIDVVAWGGTTMTVKKKELMRK